jgi:hypothetical protein
MIARWRWAESQEEDLNGSVEEQNRHQRGSSSKQPLDNVPHLGYGMSMKEASPTAVAEFLDGNQKRPVGAPGEKRFPSPLQAPVIRASAQKGEGP